MTLPRFHRVRSVADLRHAIVPPFVLRDLLSVGTELGYEAERWLDGTGTTASRLASGRSQVSWAQGVKVIQAALSEAGQHPLGLLIAKRETLSSYGLLGFAIMSAPTLQDVLMAGVQYHQLAGSFTNLGFQIGGDDVSLFLEERTEGATDVLPFLCEELFGGLLVCLRELLGPGFTPVRVCFAYPRPSYASQYVSVFGPELSFGSDVCRMVFPRSWLSWRMPSGNPIAFAQALELCEKSGPQIASQGTRFLDEVRAILDAEVRAMPDLRILCARLNMSERSFRRRLALECVSYRQLTQEAMTAEARRLLSRGKTVQEVSDALGFSEPREFRRAFKRATGCLPSEVARLEAEAKLESGNQTAERSVLTTPAGAPARSGGRTTRS